MVLRVRRSCLVMTLSDDDKFTHIMNFGRPDDKPALRYKTFKTPIEFEGKKSEAIAVEWLGPAENVDVDESVEGPKQRDKSTAKTIKTLTKKFLASGMKTSDELKEHLKDNGIDTEKNWQRCLSNTAENGKGGPDGSKGSKTYWWLPTAKQMEFDK
jgi:hypothetical protein